MAAQKRPTKRLRQHRRGIPYGTALRPQSAPADPRHRASWMLRRLCRHFAHLMAAGRNHPPQVLAKRPGLSLLSLLSLALVACRAPVRAASRHRTLAVSQRSRQVNNQLMSRGPNLRGAKFSRRSYHSALSCWAAQNLCQLMPCYQCLRLISSDLRPVCHYLVSPWAANHLFP